jgi:hypothetical protein
LLRWDSSDGSGDSPESSAAPSRDSRASPEKTGDSSDDGGEFSDGGGDSSDDGREPWENSGELSAESWESFGKSPGFPGESREFREIPEVSGVRFPALPAGYQPLAWKMAGSGLGAAKILGTEGKPGVFSLTLALSRWEREPRSLRLGER